MNPAKLSAASGSRTMTMVEFSLWADISIPDAKAEIDAGRLGYLRIGSDSCVELDEAFRWMKARYGVSAPCYWRHLPSDGRKINPFTDDLLLAPIPLSTVIL